MGRVVDYVVANYDELLKEVRKRFYHDLIKAEDILHDVIRDILKRNHTRYDDYEDEHIKWLIIKAARCRYIRLLNKQKTEKEIIEKLKENCLVCAEDAYDDETFETVYNKNIQSYVKSIEGSGSDVAYRHIFDGETLRSIAEEQDDTYDKVRKRYSRFVKRIMDDPNLSDYKK
ncbi:MAG TPA: hypothetical protein DEO82_06970 [Eubacterium sp.]|nr:hypothetical protein [Eubacterium sp.]